MTAHRLIERWEAPQGYRLASVIASTYELQADFLEEDLLPVALGLRLPPARGRDFRLELEHALGTTEVSITRGSASSASPPRTAFRRSRDLGSG